MEGHCNTCIPRFMKKRKQNHLKCWISVFLQLILPGIHFLFSFSSFLEALCRSVLLFLSPAHRGSGSRSLSAGPARKSLPTEGWRACLCGGRWSSRRTLRRRPRSTFAPVNSGTWRLYPAARGTPGPPTTAAAWKWARWSSPREHKNKKTVLKIFY